MTRLIRHAALLAASVALSAPARAQTTAPASAGDASAAVRAVEALRAAVKEAGWITYTARVTTQGPAGRPPMVSEGDVTLERGEGGAWKILVDGSWRRGAGEEAKTTPVHVAYDGQRARALRESSREVAEVIGPLPAELMAFFAAERAGLPVLWELISGEPLSAAKPDRVRDEGERQADGQACRVVRLTLTLPERQAGADPIDVLGGRYVLSNIDGFPRRVERFGPTMKGAPAPGGAQADQPIRTVEISKVTLGQGSSRASFAIEPPAGYALRAARGRSVPPERPAQAGGESTLLALGSPAPALALSDASGAKRSLEDFKGRPVVVEFFGSWCSWCAKTVPLMERVRERFKDGKAEVLGVSCERSDKADPAAFLKEHGGGYTLLTGGCEAAKAYRVASWPTVYVIDPAGKIVLAHEGFDPALDEKIAKALEAAASSPAPPK